MTTSRQLTSDKSILFGLVADLQESARRGDWKSARETTVLLRKQNLPTGERDLGDYLSRLREALLVARTSRSHTAATLSRVNAAAEFNRTRIHLLPPRQNFAEPPDS